MANLVIWLTEKLFHRFSVTNNAVLSELTWKGLDLKNGIKSPFKDLKICQEVKDKHKRNIFLPVG